MRAVVVLGLLTHRALVRDALLRHFVGLRAVCGMRRQPVAVRVVREAEPFQACSPPAESDDLDDEDEEDAEEADAECVGLGECCLTSASARG